MPNSVVVVQAAAGRVELVAYVPISELKAATDDRPAGEAGQYLLEHAAVIGQDGRPWRRRLDTVKADIRDGSAAISVTLTFTPAAGGARQAATLRYDAVIHRIASHFVLIYRREGEAMVPLTRLQSPATEVPLP